MKKMTTIVLTCSVLFLLSLLVEYTFLNVYIVSKPSVFSLNLNTVILLKVRREKSAMKGFQIVLSAFAGMWGPGVGDHDSNEETYVLFLDGKGNVTATHRVDGKFVAREIASNKLVLEGFTPPPRERVGLPLNFFYHDGPVSAAAYQSWKPLDENRYILDISGFELLFVEEQKLSIRAGDNEKILLDVQKVSVLLADGSEEKS